MMNIKTTFLINQIKNAQIQAKLILLQLAPQLAEFFGESITPEQVEALSTTCAHARNHELKHPKIFALYLLDFMRDLTQALDSFKNDNLDAGKQQAVLQLIAELSDYSKQLGGILQTHGKLFDLAWEEDFKEE